MPYEIDLDELESRIFVGLKTAPKHAKTKLRSKLALESDQAAKQIVAHIIARSNLKSAISGSPTPDHKTPAASK